MKTQEINFYTHLESVFISIILFATLFYIAIGFDKWLSDIFVSRVQTGLIMGFIAGVIMIVFNPMVKNNIQDDFYPTSVSFVAFLSLFLFVQIKNLVGFLIPGLIFVIVVLADTLFFNPGNLKSFLIYVIRSLYQGAFIILFAVTLMTLNTELVAISSIIGFILLVDYFNNRFIIRSV